MLQWIRGWFARDKDNRSAALELEMIRAGAPQEATRTPPPSRGQSLRRAALGTPVQRRRMARLGVRTTADLMALDARNVEADRRLPPAAWRTVRRWQWAIRQSQRLRPMRPLDCLLAAAVYRRTPHSIARSRPSHLLADIQRYALSSSGVRMVADHRLPTLEEVQRWVDAAQRLERQHAQRLERQHAQRLVTTSPCLVDPPPPASSAARSARLL